MNTYHRGQKPMIRQELESRRFNVRLELVEFHTVAVVDENILLLCYGEMGVVLEEPRAWVTDYPTRRRGRY